MQVIQPQVHSSVLIVNKKILIAFSTHTRLVIHFLYNPFFTIPSTRGYEAGDKVS